MLAVPIVGAVYGLAYALVMATEQLLAAAGAMGLDVIIGSLVKALPTIYPATAQGSIVLGAATSVAGVASTMFSLALPLLLTVLVNLVLGFLANYRNWHKKARRWAIALNLVGLLIYLIPQIIMMIFAFESLSSEVLLLGLFFAVWDSYFLISLFLWYRLPSQAEILKIAKIMPALHMPLWLLLASLWGLVLTVAALLELLSFNVFTVAGSVIILLSALPLVLNAKTAKKIARGCKKRSALFGFLVSLILTILGLIFVPPVGAALLISTAWLFFLMETAFWPRREPSVTLTADG